MNEIIELIVDNYELDEELYDQLELRYDTRDRQGKRRSIVMTDDEVMHGKMKTTETGEVRQVQLEDVTLFRVIPAGIHLEEDVTCDSDFMMRTMPEVGEAIRRTMHWIPRAQPIYLQMDNAGGHGTKNAMREYTQRLANDYNVIVKYQPARSPEMNALDLGLWTSLQSKVEVEHRDKCTNSNAIAHSVQQARKELPSATISRVFERIPVVLQLIVDDDGGNDKVEDRRGQLIVAP